MYNTKFTLSTWKLFVAGAKLACLVALPTSLAVAKDYPPRTMQFIAPAGAGGGWDLTIRTVAKTLKDTKLTTANMPITNRPGGGGGVNLSYMQTQKGKDNLISVYSPPILLIKLNGTSKYGYKDTTPIAGLIADYQAFIVPKNSRFKSINDVILSLKKDIKSVKVGGASAAGSMDHITFLMLARAAGIKDFKNIDYIAFQSSGSVAQVLGGHVDLIVAGLGDVESLVESGKLKVLAQTASKRIGQGVLAQIPTVKEQGIDMSFVNWRGLFGPKDMPEYAVKYWSEALAKMVETKQWKEALVRNGWDSAYLNSADFSKFLEKSNDEYKSILSEIFK